MQLGLSAAQLAGGRSRWTMGIAGAFMLGDAAYSVYASKDRGAGMQVVRVLRGALGAVFVATALAGRGGVGGGRRR